MARKMTAARVDRLGNLYLKELDTSAATAVEASLPARPPASAAAAAGATAAAAATRPAARRSRKLLKVNGEDGRVEVTNPAYPWSAVGMLEFEDAEGGGSVCSGALVGARVVITAGHVRGHPEVDGSWCCSLSQKP